MFVVRIKMNYFYKKMCISLKDMFLHIKYGFLIKKMFYFKMFPLKDKFLYKKYNLINNMFLNVIQIKIKLF